MRNMYATHPDDFYSLGDEQINGRFRYSDLFQAGHVHLLHTHHDRMVVGGAVPEAGQRLELPVPAELRSPSFTTRRELALFNLGGGSAIVHVGGAQYTLEREDCLYLGRGERDISFESPSGEARLYLVSALSHVSLPDRIIRRHDAAHNSAGDQSTGNARHVRKYLHEDGAPSSQLVVGITSLDEGNVWNSMPPHTHDRRTEIYTYFGLGEGNRVQHLMGLPGRPRTFAVGDLGTVVSPSWSMHLGAGSKNYAFVWAMAGENQAFTDMDQVPVDGIG